MELLIFFLFLFWSMILSLFLVYLTLMIFPKTYTKTSQDVFKETAYECGFKPMSNVDFPFDVHFYSVGMLFLIFDVEIAFCFPWVVNFYEISLCGHFAMFFLLFVLLFAFIFEWSLQILKWS